MTLQKYTDDAIGLVVTLAATGYAGYITYLTGEIPEFFAVAFGLIIAFHFKKEKGTK